MNLIHLIITYATMLGVDPYIALSVASVESNIQMDKVGELGEIGVFQILPEYSGYSPTGLSNPHINVMAGINRIKETQSRCKYKDDLYYLICYNMGYEGAKRIRYPDKNEYVKRIRKELTRWKTM